MRGLSPAAAEPASKGRIGAACALAGHLQAQMPHKVIEIAIAVQEREFLLDDESGNQAVNGLPYCDPLAAQSAIVLGALEGHLGSAQRVDWKEEQCSPGSLKVLLAAITLKHLTQDDVPEANLLLAEGCIQQVGLWGNLPAEVVDPDGGINDPHPRIFPPS